MIDLHDQQRMLASGVRLDQYFGAWAIEPGTAARLIEMTRGMNWAAHQSDFLARTKGADAPTQNQPIRQQGAIAIVALEGSLMKQADSMTGGTSTVSARMAVRAAARDPDVSAILLCIDSPGGTISGTSDLADEITAARLRKPVMAFVEDTCCSAAYWVASQCEAIYANSATARVGSIGTYTYLFDQAKQFADDGVETVVFATGELKGMGIPGSKITEAQRADMQQYIYALQESFSGAVAKGRNMPASAFDPKATNTLATGGVWLAADAVQNGLIDGIATFDQVLTKLSAKATSAGANPPRSQTEIVPMATETNTAPIAASYAELKVACKGAEGAFLAECQENGMTVDQARDHWMETLAARAESRAEEVKKAELALAQEQAKSKGRPGAQTMAEGKSDGADQSDARALWVAEIAKHEKAGKSRAQAVIAANASLPGIRERMVADDNTGRKR